MSDGEFPSRLLNQLQNGETETAFCPEESETENLNIAD